MIIRCATKSLYNAQSLPLFSLLQVRRNRRRVHPKVWEQAKEMHLAAADNVLDTIVSFFLRDHRTGSPRGFAFVRFLKQEDADSAITGLDGRTFEGRELRIQLAQRQRPTDPKQYYASQARRLVYFRRCMCASRKLLGA